MASYRSVSGARVPALLRNDIKSAAMSLNGLKTVQSCYTYVLSSEPLNTIVTSLMIMDPETLIDNLQIAAGSNRKFYVQSAEGLIYLSNATNVRLVVNAYKVKCIKNCPLQLEVLLADDAPSPTIPYINPTSSNSFRRYFHIEDARFDTIPVEGCIMYELSDYFPSCKLVDFQVEANLDKFEYTVGSKVWMLFISSQPVENSVSALSAGPTSCKVNVMDHLKYTYRMPKDNDPSSSGTTTIVPVAAADARVISDATRVNYQTDNP